MLTRFFQQFDSRLASVDIDLKNDRDRFKAGTLILPTLFNPKSAIQNPKWYDFQQEYRVVRAVWVSTCFPIVTSPVF
jgi:hypothetical protein